MGQRDARGTESRDAARERIWNSKFITLLIINLLVMLGNYTMRPVISNYAIELGATFAVAGAIAGLAFAVATLLRPVTGYLSDRLNKKTSLIIALAAFSISSFGCALSQSMVLMGLFSAIQGIALSFQAVGLTALAALCVPRSRIGTAVGWMGIAMTVSMAVGPGITSFIASWGGYRASFVFGGILCAIGFVLILLFKAPPGAEGRRPEADAEKAASSAKARIGSVISQSFHLPTMPIALAGLMAVWAPSCVSMLLLTVQEIGYLDGATWYFALYAVAALGARPLAGWLADRFRTAAVAVPLLLLGAVAMMVPIFAHDVPAVVVCGLLAGLGSASGSSVIQAESVRGVDNDHLGRATNTYYLGVDLGCALGVWAGGLLMQAGTPALMFGFNAFTCVLAAVIISILLIVRRRRQA